MTVTTVIKTGVNDQPNLSIQHKNYAAKEQETNNLLFTSTNIFIWCTQWEKGYTIKNNTHRGTAVCRLFATVRPYHIARAWYRDCGDTRLHTCSYTSARGIRHTLPPTQRVQYVFHILMLKLCFESAMVEKVPRDTNSKTSITVHRNSTPSRT